MEQEIQSSPQELNSIFLRNKNSRIIMAVSLLIVALLIAVGYSIFSKRLVKPVAIQAQQLSQNPDISKWQRYQNAQYGFEVQYPDGWLVYYDKVRYPESARSDPRFLITKSDSVKDSKCYASFIFADVKNPSKYPHSLHSEISKKQECQVTLDNIIATFKLVNDKQTYNITLYAYEKDGSHIFDGAVIAAIDTPTGKIVTEQIAGKDGKVVFPLIPGDYHFQPSPLRENRVVGSLNLSVPLNENKPQILLLTEIGPSGFGAPVNTCEEKYEAINLALEQANYCERESDCKSFQPGGFSCYIYTNESFDGSTVLQRVSDYSNACRLPVYKCAQLQRSPRCIQGKCYTGK